MSSPIRGSYKSDILGYKENVKYYHILSQLDGSTILTWILLYNQSTVDILSNKKLQRNISKANRDLAIFLTGGIGRVMSP